MKGRLIRLIGSLLLLGALFWWSSPEVIWSRLQQVNPWWILAAFLSLTVSSLSMARRWQITAKALDLDIRYPAALREYYLSLLANSLLPGGVVGDVGRAVRARHHGDLKRAAQSVLAERLIGQAAMLCVLFVCLFFALLLPGGINWPSPTGWVLALALALAVSIILGFAFARPTAAFTRFCVALMMRGNIQAHSFAAAGLLIFGLYACARATGTDLSLEASLTILPLVFCAMLVPLSVAGWGWREGAAAALFPLIGASTEAGISMGIWYGVVMLLAALPAVGFLVFPIRPPLDAKTLENV